MALAATGAGESYTQSIRPQAAGDWYSTTVYSLFDAREPRVAVLLGEQEASTPRGLRQYSTT